MPVRYPKVSTEVKAANGTTPIVFVAVDVGGYTDLSIHVTNGSAGQAATFKVYSTTSTTAPTATTGMHIQTVAAGTAISYVCPASGTLNGKVVHSLGGLSARYILVTGELAGAGTENLTLTVTGVASGGGTETGL